MEPETKVYCYDNKPKKQCCKKNTCLLWVVEIFLIAFTVSLGILIGAIASEAILAALAAIIVFIVISALLLITAIILYLCKKTSHK